MRTSSYELSGNLAEEINEAIEKVFYMDTLNMQYKMECDWFEPSKHLR